MGRESRAGLTRSPHLAGRPRGGGGGLFVASGRGIHHRPDGVGERRDDDGLSSQASGAARGEALVTDYGTVAVGEWTDREARACPRPAARAACCASGSRRRPLRWYTLTGGGEAPELLAAVSDDRCPVGEQEMVEVNLRGEPREAVAEALLLRLGVVAEQEVGEEPQAVVVGDAVRDRDRAVAGDLERRLVGPGLGESRAGRCRRSARRRSRTAAPGRRAGRSSRPRRADRRAQARRSHIRAKAERHRGLAGALHVHQPGAGRDGLLPWPAREYECVEASEHRGAGWNTTRWEVEFVRLLSDLQGIDDWDFDEVLRGWGLRIHEESPLDPYKARDE
jgi:hypothetical protein